jgi:hypothetical protein
MGLGDQGLPLTLLPKCEGSHAARPSSFGVGGVNVDLMI